MIAVQFATGKSRCSGRTASPLTSGTISGTPGCMRNEALLSMTTMPRSSSPGAYFSLASSPPAKKTTSKPRSASSDAVRTSSRSPRKATAALRSREANGPRCAMGTLRSSRTCTIVSPTAPVAPTTATFMRSRRKRSRDRSPARGGARRRERRPAFRSRTTHGLTNRAESSTTLRFHPAAPPDARATRVIERYE